MRRFVWMTGFMLLAMPALAETEWVNIWDQRVGAPSYEAGLHNPDRTALLANGWRELYDEDRAPSVESNYVRVGVAYIQHPTLAERAKEDPNDIYVPPTPVEVAAWQQLHALAPLLADHPATNTIPYGGMFYRLTDEGGNLTLWFMRDEDHIATQLSAHDAQGKPIIRTRRADGTTETIAVGAVMEAARITTAKILSEMSADEIAATLAIYPDWAAGEAVSLDALRVYGGKLYKCVQAHTTQSDWTPDATPALWAAVAPAGTIADWVQPTGAQDAYALGARVMHNGVMWESTVGANVWEPGVYGWTEVTE